MAQPDQPPFDSPPMFVLWIADENAFATLPQDVQATLTTLIENLQNVDTESPIRIGGWCIPVG